MVRELIDLIGPPERFHFAVDDLPNIHTPPTAIKRVFLNLIDNAIKHHDRSEGRISIGARDLGALVEFSIADDGPGIPPIHHEKVFAIFQTLKRRDNEASGVGLALVKKSVEAFGGTIQLESENRGSTFRFTWKKGNKQ